MYICEQRNCDWGGIVVFIQFYQLQMQNHKNHYDGFVHVIPTYTNLSLIMFYG